MVHRRRTRHSESITLCTNASESLRLGVMPSPLSSRVVQPSGTYAYRVGLLLA